MAVKKKRLLGPFFFCLLMFIFFVVGTELLYVCSCKSLLSLLVCLLALLFVCFIYLLVCLTFTRSFIYILFI